MGKIIYNSNLSKYFIINSISDVTDTSISGDVIFNNSPSFMVAEILAQLASFHTKHCIDFKKHTYLLKIQSHDYFDRDCLKGKFLISGKLVGKSENAYSYDLIAENEDTKFYTKLIIGIDNSGINFSDNLNSRNKRLFECLRHG